MNAVVRNSVAGVLLLGAVALVAGCQADQTFEEFHVQHQKEIGNKDPQLVDSTKVDGYTVALDSTAGGDDGRRFGADIYENTEKGWKQVNGTTCTDRPARLGFKSVSVFCGTLGDREQNVVNVQVEGKDVKMVPRGDLRVWYAVADDPASTVQYLGDNGVVLKRFDLNR